MANLTAIELNNLISNVSKVMDNVTVKGGRLAAEWRGKWWGGNPDGTITAYWQPLLAVSLEDISEDLKAKSWQSGEWLENEVKSLGWAKSKAGKRAF